MTLKDINTDYIVAFIDIVNGGKEAFGKRYKSGKVTRYTKNTTTGIVELKDGSKYRLTAKHADKRVTYICKEVKA